MIDNPLYEDFPDEASLRFRVHVLCVYAQSTLGFASAIAEEGPDNLAEEDLKLFDDLAQQCERIWIEAVKMQKRARHIAS